jgi:hypothetical protein
MPELLIKHKNIKTKMFPEFTAPKLCSYLQLHKTIFYQMSKDLILVRKTQLSELAMPFFHNNARESTPFAKENGAKRNL